MNFLFVTALLLLSTPVNTTEDVSQLPRKHPLEEVVGHEKATVAKEIETHLVSLGFSKSLARAATINAYAESKLNPRAIGDKGKSVGVFQLHSRGLGHKMSVEERQDIKTSTEKIAWLVYKEGTLIEMQENCASLEDLVKAFTIKIERPSNAKKKAVERAKLVEYFRREIDDCA